MGTSGEDSITTDGTGTAELAIKSDKSTPNTLRIRTTGVTARDITLQFANASSALENGQLVKDDYFTLFEAVGALEIMDPKMDNGYLAPGEALEDEYDVMEPPSPHEIIGVMDQLLCHEHKMAWHQGNPLSQTLFTSLYIDKLLSASPKALEDAHFGCPYSPAVHRGDVPASLLHIVLRTYCLALLKCCNCVHRRIEAEHCYEEEDFVTHLYNRSLLHEVPEPEVSTLLDEALQWLEKKEAGIISEHLREALRTRLEFRKAFLGAVSKDLGVIKDQSTVEWETCAKYLQAIADSHKLGKPVERSFSVKIQRKLASTIPPRPMVNISFDNALSHLKRLCQDGTDLAVVLNFCGSSDLLTFVWTFQSRKPQPSVYIRALLQTLICTDDMVLGKISVKQLLYDDLAEIVLPADILLDVRNWEVEHPGDRRFQIRKRMDEFAARAGQSYIDIFRAICQNRSRIRRTLCHTLRDWESLQMDAEELDNELRPLTGEEPVIDVGISPEPIFAFPLSSWAYYHKLKQMEWIIQLGFELQIYQPDELLGMYWYLQHIVQTRIRHLERIRGFVTRKLGQLPVSTEDAKIQKGDITRSLSFLNFSMLEATATQTFSGAMFYFYSALHRLHLVDSPPRPYSSDALRYEIRMKPFLHIGLPELVPFEDFRAFAVQTQDSASRLLAAAASAVARLRKDYEMMGKMEPATTHSVLCVEWWTKNLKDSLRASIATSIAIAMLIKAVKAKGDVTDEEWIPTVKVDLTRELSAEGQGGYHPFWIVPKIVDRAK
ncbi:MAG: hypothetical protein M1839_005313 [Geoglossum umbratile]|nr:MAG: hypothetical protein M1839_005313 [Geoglossum umbratile]